MGNIAHCKLCDFKMFARTASFLRHLKQEHFDKYKTLNIEKQGRYYKKSKESPGDDVEDNYERDGLKSELSTKKSRKRTSEARKHFDYDDEKDYTKKKTCIDIWKIFLRASGQSFRSTLHYV